MVGNPSQQETNLLIIVPTVIESLSSNSTNSEQSKHTIGVYKYYTLNSNSFFFVEPYLILDYYPHG